MRILQALTSCVRISSLCLGIVLLASTAGIAVVQEPVSCWPGFVLHPKFSEQVREIRFATQARAIIIAPDATRFHEDKPTLLVIYATPNGNTIEQTLGCRPEEGLDWHFNIQHAAAQVRKWQEMYPKENLVLACVQANIRSWPTWRGKYAESDRLIRNIVSAVAGQVPSDDLHIVLTGHSGGGSFITGYVNSVENIPSKIRQITYLDANYSYSTDLQHGRKFLEWLNASPENTLLVLAYDDREIELNGKKVVGPTGGTYRASHRMLDYLKDEIDLKVGELGDFASWEGLDGRLRVLIHPNPENKILHTRLVGEMNGLLYALALDGKNTDAAELLDTPRKYSEWVQSKPFQPDQWKPASPAIPTRPTSSPTGSQFVGKWSSASASEREAAVLSELLSGNVPQFLRRFHEITIEGKAADGTEHQVTLRVMPDYLALGSDEDFLRIPITPETAQLVADTYGCLLPTRKIVDAVYEQADVKVEPKPLTEDREALTTFLQHHQIIESQLEGQDEPHAKLVAGTKKDVVISNEVPSRPGHVAIYGWHKLDGKPIQPLTTVHIAEYVDYSHGARLLDLSAVVDGKTMRVDEVLRDLQLQGLLSDEGAVAEPSYPPATNTK